jgi:hypothetical protein
VEDGVTGLLVPAGDPTALRAALVELLGDPALRARLGGAARERAVVPGGRPSVDALREAYVSAVASA